MSNKIILVILFFVVVLACEDENNGGGDSSQQLIFESLTAENDTIVSGETTTITATATGYNLEYHWSATAGDLLGAGAVITYTSSPCNIGVNTITCTVKDGNSNSETKSVDIVVE